MNKYIKTLFVTTIVGSSNSSMIESIRYIKNRHVPSPIMTISAGANQQRGKVQHGAIDISMPVGTPIYAIADAEIIKAKELPRNRSGIYKKHGGTSDSLCGSGVSLKVKHPGSPSGYTYVNYCHLSKVNPKLKKGLQVKGGDLLGYSGGAKGDYGAGNTTGPHLHITIRPGDTYFKSNSLASNPKVYDNWFKDARKPGDPKGVGKLAIWGGITSLSFISLFLGYKIIS